MNREDMTQSFAVEKAWQAAEVAERLAHTHGAEITEWAAVSRAWSAVAGQLEFVTTAATEPERVPDDAPTEVFVRPAVPGGETDLRPYPGRVP